MVSGGRNQGVGVSTGPVNYGPALQAGGGDPFGFAQQMYGYWQQMAAQPGASPQTMANAQQWAKQLQAMKQARREPAQQQQQQTQLSPQQLLAGQVGMGQWGVPDLANRPATTQQTSGGQWTPNPNLSTFGYRSDGRIGHLPPGMEPLRQTQQQQQQGGPLYQAVQQGVRQPNVRPAHLAPRTRGPLTQAIYG